MNIETGIEWTDVTSNPLKYRDKETGQIVWACVKHSPGCAHCYAETLAKRYGRGGPFTRESMAKVEPFVCDKELKSLINSKKLRGKRVFVGDMTDLFGEWVTDEMLDKLFITFAIRADATFQVLTKRADRMAAYFCNPHCSARLSFIFSRWLDYGNDMLFGNEWRKLYADARDLSTAGSDFDGMLDGVWLGVSVENQQAADARIPHLLRVPAKVRFLSCEPLLGPVRLQKWFCEQTYRCRKCEMEFQESERASSVSTTSPIRCPFCNGGADPEGALPTEDIGWVIVGGESGAGSRPCRVEWIRSIVKQCKSAGVPCFVKQLGANIIDRNDAGFDAESWTHAEGADEGKPVDDKAWPTPLDIEEHIHGHLEQYQGADVRVKLVDKKGGDWSEWPEDLRVRQFPEAAS